MYKQSHRSKHSEYMEEREEKSEKKHKGKKYSDSDMKPDKTCHYGNEDLGTMAKKASLPGQMYVPKKDHNESDFAGEER